jgi:hypothetical protein
MHGNVKRRKALLQDSTHIACAQSCKGDKIAIKKGVAVILVLYIEGAAQSLGELVDEAEQACIAAAPWRRGTEPHSKNHPVFPVRFDFPDLTGRLDNFQDQFIIPCMEAEVDDIPQMVAVDCRKPVARFYSGLIGKAARLNGLYDETPAHCAEKNEVVR